MRVPAAGVVVPPALGETRTVSLHQISNSAVTNHAVLDATGLVVQESVHRAGQIARWAVVDNRRIPVDDARYSAANPAANSFTGGLALHFEYANGISFVSRAGLCRRTWNPSHCGDREWRPANMYKIGTHRSFIR